MKEIYSKKSLTTKSSQNIEIGVNLHWFWDSKEKFAETCKLKKKQKDYCRNYAILS